MLIFIFILSNVLQAQHLELRPRFEVSYKELDPSYLSFAIDLSQVTGRSWWSPEIKNEGALGSYQVPRIDWSNKHFLNLFAPFKNSYLRLGGSLADELTYTDEELSDIHKWSLFASQAGLKMMLTVNAVNEKGWSKILQWDKDNNHPVKVWEFGNEPNAYVILHGFSGWMKSIKHIQAWKNFKKRMEKNSSSHLAGPATAFWPLIGEPLSFLWGGTKNFIQQAQPPIITWHYYPQQSQRCGLRLTRASIERMLDPEALDEVIVHAKKIKKWRDQYSPQSEIWLGETGNAQCGGEPGISDRWISSLWWIDQLALLSQHGTNIVIRQAIKGADYGLLSEDLTSIRPDYWVSLVWKKIVQGHPVLHDPLNKLVRTYFFLKDKKLTLVAINLDGKNHTLNYGQHKWNIWRVHAQSLTSKRVFINKVPMPYKSSHQQGPPSLPNPIIKQEITLLPYSIIFAQTQL